ncbi:succinate dehydrogenase assembly factor 3, mitochondrial-like [Homarus americanus]|uniref:Succinate dehydrogenase assembly factor 3 n=1 Tax=Homarus americanus TaxID=6706 RepID=A0A8J5JXJ6_HOMAM|nr:succinate dehydrogenase assembly factor 3, mitochondrial-like [Homarus americanus]XP_042227168.1 succinate dehydrogenase assembly factor 3, mitochondrial-like [Homarus americanus]XP_042227169.1 succinate dehydrogenase assembly factor 3, mitochondrial-like [Homarus americanus]XP_042227170.1 succinate dehydrogenase assembly factor 3, mitochondrial-like [Homarus americanus]XP_042227171.1 succinate dehydrogenase assembly factor 3, mitochondrial-like [Homarus americanus]XP_042227172.1 succinate 
MMATVQAFTHTQRVRVLYKTILKLHRGLPLELKALGDQYIRDEFQRHKEAAPEQAQAFMVEWTNYAVTMAKQLGIRGTHTAKTIGKPLKEGELDNFTGEQIYQLFELHEAATKPEADVTNSMSDK